MMSLLPLLIIVAGLLLLMGFTAFLAILFLAKRRSRRPDNKSKQGANMEISPDAWTEAGNRVDVDPHEQEL